MAWTYVNHQSSGFDPDKWTGLLGLRRNNYDNAQKEVENTFFYGLFQVILWKIYIFCSWSLNRKLKATINYSQLKFFSPYLLKYFKYPTTSSPQKIFFSIFYITVNNYRSLKITSLDSARPTNINYVESQKLILNLLPFFPSRKIFLKLRCIVNKN